MNPNYVASALCYHGQPLQKIWEDERGVDDLRQMRITQPSYTIYLERQKYFTFQERAKRLKMHQFLARKAEDLYGKQMVGNNNIGSKIDELANGMKHIAPVPPYECLLRHVKDKAKHCNHLLLGLKPGDIIYAVITKVMVLPQRIHVKPLCTAEPMLRYLADIPIKAEIIAEHMGALPLGPKGVPRSYSSHDYIRCEIQEVSADAERLTLGMTGVHNKSTLSLGLVDLKQFPKYYRKLKEIEGGCNYEQLLQQSPEFENPNYEILYQLNGLNMNDNFSLMKSLKYDFPSSEYASELRQAQASKWAFHYVAEGIEHFKNGQQIEAFQCLNKALTIDPCNVEGLVARGALYANKGSFLKAIEDFEKALKLNSFHVNARKYMGETLVALGHNYEEENRIQEAVKAYNDCLLLIPNHEQARLSLDALQRAGGHGSGVVIYDDFLQVPTGDNNYNNSAADNSSSDSNEDADGRCGVGAAGDSSDSESESSTANAKQSPRQSQLPPAFGKPYFVMMNEKQPGVSSVKNANEFKLDDDETVSQVRKLLREASKHKKNKKKTDKKRIKKSKKDKQQEILDMEYLKKLDFEQAYRTMQQSGQIDGNRDMYAHQSREIFSPIRRSPTTYQQQSNYDATFDIVGPSTSRQAASVNVRAESPIPPAPKMLMTDDTQQQRLSFQIKRPIKVDKFGLVRLASPMSMNPNSFGGQNASCSRSTSPYHRDLASTRRGYSPTPSRSRSRSRYRLSALRRTRSRSPAFGTRQRRRERSPYRRNNRRRTHSRSRERLSRRGGPTSPNYRRTPSPFVPRGTPSPRSRFRRSRSPAPSTSVSRYNRARRSRSPCARDQRGAFNQRRPYGNRVWNRNITDRRRRSRDSSDRDFEKDDKPKGKDRDDKSKDRENGDKTKHREKDDKTKSRDKDDKSKERDKDNRSKERDKDNRRSKDRENDNRTKDKDGKTKDKVKHMDKDKNEEKDIRAKNDKSQETKKTTTMKTADNTIEEIDKIINKAQKERKEEIIKRDKDIVKKKESETA